MTIGTDGSHLSGNPYVCTTFSTRVLQSSQSNNQRLSKLKTIVFKMADQPVLPISHHSGLWWWCMGLAVGIPRLATPHSSAGTTPTPQFVAFVLYTCHIFTYLWLLQVGQLHGK